MNYKENYKKSIHKGKFSKKTRNKKEVENPPN